MTRLISIWQPIAGLFRWFYRTTIAPTDSTQKLPPIRYDGDPQDIYLA